MKHEYICIVCPMSCDLALSDENGEVRVRGNTCRRGEAYAKSEYTNPVRMITTTVSLTNSHRRLLPVISTEAVPKSRLWDCLNQLYSITVKAPVKAGDVIVRNIMDTGVDIISAKTVES
ncbi:MAG: DUF1667 domain-containing protein [Clostridium sp.]|nr:DUF1667 domain-containing protein [Clostridium sp.]